VCENQAAAVGISRAMQQSAHERIDGDIGENLRAGISGHKSYTPTSSSFS
jgi:hypothetical protein